MQRFYFHLDRGGILTIDCEGSKLPDLEAARAVAIRSARDVIIGDVVDGCVHLDHQISIADTAGFILLEVPFSDAVKVRKL